MQAIKRRIWKTCLGLAGAATVLALLGHYGYVRMTVLPPLNMDGYKREAVVMPVRPAGDVTAELVPILRDLRGEIPVNPPQPPAGMQWDWSPTLGRGRQPPARVEISDAVAGAWEPEQRPCLQAIITYLELPSKRAEIDKLHALCGRPFVVNYWTAMLRGPTAGEIQLVELRNMAKVLAADARYQAAGHRDPAAAWADLKAVLWLADTLEPDGAFPALMSAGCAGIALTELRHMLLENDVSPALLAEMEEVLRRERKFEDVWVASIAEEERFTRATVDLTFTRDAAGDGWLVPTRVSEWGREFDTGVWGGTSVVWNLGAGLYNGRATVVAKLNQLFAQVREAGLQPYQIGAAVLEALPERCGFNRCDGPILSKKDYLQYEPYLQLMTGAVARRQASLVAVALARFKAARGVYPADLAELVPEYLDQLPADPFGSGPFVYRRTEDGQYLLWSVGPNGVDDHGTGEAYSDRPKKDGDIFYVLLRPVSSYTGRLVPIGAAASEPATDGAGTEQGDEQ